MAVETCSWVQQVHDRGLFISSRSKIAPSRGGTFIEAVLTGERSSTVVPEVRHGHTNCLFPGPTRQRCREELV